MPYELIRVSPRCSIASNFLNANINSVRLGRPREGIIRGTRQLQVFLAIIPLAIRFRDDTVQNTRLPSNRACLPLQWQGPEWDGLRSFVDARANGEVAPKRISGEDDSGA